MKPKWAVIANEDDEIRSIVTMKHNSVTLGQCIAAHLVYCHSTEITVQLIVEVNIRRMSNVPNGIQLDSQLKFSFNFIIKKIVLNFVIK